MKKGHNRLSTVFQQAPRISFDDTSRIIFFSDVHRGDNSWADEFAKNKILYSYALQYYFDEGYTYIEVGDGDELLKNAGFDRIWSAHHEVFDLIKAFYDQNRLYILLGNHDIERQDPDVVAEDLFWRYDEIEERLIPFLNGISIHQGLVLKHLHEYYEIFIVHGHQVDRLVHFLGRMSSFLIYRLWRPFQLMGFQDPTSASQNPQIRSKIEQELISWIEANQQPLICGHTHRAVFPINGDTPYFNTGSVIHPRWITGIEIDKGKILQVRWRIRPEKAGHLRVKREVIAGPRSLRDFYPYIKNSGFYSELEEPIAVEIPGVEPISSSIDFQN